MARNDSPPRADGVTAPVAPALVDGHDRPGQPVATIPETPAENLPPAEPFAPAATLVECGAATELEAPPAGVPVPDLIPGAETELKLVTGPGQLPTFRDAPVIAANARNRGVHRHLRAVYYDTADRRLRKAGLTLRVRRSGSRFTQTVKSGFAADPLHRGEWEAAVPTAEPDLALALPFLPEKLGKALSPELLEPVFTTDIHRLNKVIILPSGTVEVSFDHGIIAAGERTIPIDEIELELREGSARTLYDLALRLMEHGPVRPSVRAKADRGFDLADDRPPAAPKPGRPGLDPGAPVDEAFVAILRGALLHLLNALPAAEVGASPEGVHQARVALRRLRAAFGLMRTIAPSTSLEAFDAEANWLADSLGGARDGDIFVGETLSSIERALPGLDGFAALHRLAEERRSAGYATARAALADTRTARFILTLGGWIEQRGWRGDISAETLRTLATPSEAFAQKTLALLHARVLKRGRRFDRMTTDERHRLRIAVKKLRYATDFLLPLCGSRKAAKRFAAGLAHLQEELGRYNDMATTRTIVAELGRDPAARTPAAGAVIGWQAQGLAGAEPQLCAAWKAFRTARTPWRDPAPEAA